MLLGGDGGFFVRGVMTDAEFMRWLIEYVGPVTETSPIHHGWYRWVPNLDEGGVLLYGAEPGSRGAFQAAVVDWWKTARAEEGGEE
jgi:hypothetical protein